MGNGGFVYIGILKDHLQQFVHRYIGISPSVAPDVFNLESWITIPCTPFCPITGVVLVPQQRNGYDCGVFTCTFVNYLSKNLELRFSQDDMPNFRARLTRDILRNKVD